MWLWVLVEWGGVFVLTSLKCLVVFMINGVRSFFSTFIQPWPKNSLQAGQGSA